MEAKLIPADPLVVVTMKRSEAKAILLLVNDVLRNYAVARQPVVLDVQTVLMNVINSSGGMS